MAQTIDENNENWSISLRSVFVVLKREYKIVLLITSFFSIIGFFYLLITPKEYVSTGKIMPEISYKPSNGMSGLNQLLKKYNGNVDLSNTEITSPDLYSEILNTSDFYDYIFKKEVTTINNEKMSFKSYYDFEKTKSYFKTNNQIKHHRVVDNIQKRIVIMTDRKNNLISVTAKMQDPVVAANIANFTITYLIDYITKYRTEKARQELRFIENLEKNISKDSSKSEELKKEIQNSLLTSIVQMKIKIQEDTPIIQVLEKAQIPVDNNEPSIPKAIIGSALLGFLIGIITVFLKNHNYKTFLIPN